MWEEVDTDPDRCEDFPLDREWRPLCKWEFLEELLDLVQTALSSSLSQSPFLE